MVVDALLRDGFDLTGAQLFTEDIDEVHRLYGELANNQLAESRLGRVVEAAKQCLVVPHNDPSPGDPEEPADCWAVKLYGKIHALEQHHPIAVKTAMKQRRSLWAAAGAI
jgi:hypothetical protein